ncbi:MAG TPA: anti-sigma factor [Acidimicrobiia bacterium]|nr:anti-sigma factor [Acidimicrobiia bacterium]
MNGAPESDATLDALLGAYALDAVDADDRRRVEQYLARNPSARREVDEMRETAASLALAPADDFTAPADLWDRISATVALEQGDELAARRARRRARAVVNTWVGRAAIAAAVVAVALAAEVVVLRGRLDDARQPGDKSLAVAFNRAAKVNGVHAVSLAPQGGAELARVVLLPDGTGYLRNDRLGKLSADKTYQLWAITGDPNKPAVISAGVLGNDPHTIAFRTSGPVHAFAITVEEAPGVEKSRNEPVASGAVA